MSLAFRNHASISLDIIANGDDISLIINKQFLNSAAWKFSAAERTLESDHRQECRPGKAARAEVRPAIPPVAAQARFPR
jgi:hypothetical protein